MRPLSGRGRAFDSTRCLGGGEKFPWAADGVREDNPGSAIAAGKVEPLGIYAHGEPRSPARPSASRESAHFSLRSD
jgi:hypothetical protein